MSPLQSIKNDVRLQYLVGIGTIAVISFICYLFVGFIGYHVVALILLLAVSVLAMFLDMYPIIIVAILSALTWNFLFIQPQATFSITNPQDALLFLMYFVIAVMNAVFTSKIRKAEGQAQKRQEREKTLQLYNTLFNSLSHELKTPISTIIGAVDSLRLDNLSGENKEQLLGEIDVAGNRLHRQVENMLSMSRLESEFLRLQLDWYSLDEIVYSVIKKTKAEANQHNIYYHTQENLPLFKIDGLLIEQAIQNIVQNAMQYTPVGTEIVIKTGFEGGKINLSISDSGRGFPEDKLEQVFEKFYRLPDTAAGGTGLGLSIAKGFVQAHNGILKLENLAGKGAKFTIIIPAEASAISTYHDE